MANTLRKKADTFVVPGTAATAGEAPYCVTTEEVVVSTTEGSGDYRNPVIASGRGGLSHADYQFGGAATVNGAGTKYQTVNVTTCYPGISGTPAVPNSQGTDDHTGWNAGARSVESAVGDFAFSFSMMPTPVGVLCGISDGVPDHTYAHIEYGFLGSASQLAVVESGNTRLVLTTDPAPVLSANPVFKIKRTGLVVTYSVDDTEVYVSQVASAGRMYGEACLYAAGDYVLNPLFETAAGGTATGYIHINGQSSDYAANAATGTIPVPIGTSEGRANNAAAGTIPRPTGTAFAGSYAAAAGRLPALISVSVGQGAVPIPNVALAAGKVPALIGSSLLLVGEVGEVAGRVPPPTGVSADYAYSYGGGSWPTTGYSSGNYEDLDKPGTLLFWDYMYAVDTWLVDAPYVLVSMDTIGIADHIDILMLADVQTMDYVNLNSTQSISGVLQLLAKSGVAITDQSSGANRTAIQYAVNIVTGALTEYTGYQFTRFARVNGETYACRPDGLYRLAGNTDAGDPIDALVDMGIEDWSDPHLKTVDHVYLGVTTDGQVFLKVTADEGPERTYRVQGNGNMKRSRLNGKISARQWGLKVQLVDASFASVDMVQFLVDVSDRRISGRRK